MTKQKNKIPKTLDPIQSRTSTVRKIEEPWHSTSTEKMTSYDATRDPYCPHTQTSKFKDQMRKRMFIEEKPKANPMTKSMSFIPEAEYDIGMRPMDRPISAPEQEKFPKTVTAISSAKTGGLTFSTESTDNVREGQAELDVLKTILNREGYLNRLEKPVKKIGRKFKPEIADILDFIRASSIDVVEAIVRWRETK
eukprot:gene13709-29158_t